MNEVKEVVEKRRETVGNVEQSRVFEDRRAGGEFVGEEAIHRTTGLV